jgi:hypothetical protein
MADPFASFPTRNRSNSLSVSFKEIFRTGRSLHFSQATFPLKGRGLVGSLFAF